MGQETPWGWQVGGAKKETQEGQAPGHPHAHPAPQKQNVIQVAFLFSFICLSAMGYSLILLIRTKVRK